MLGTLAQYHFDRLAGILSAAGTRVSEENLDDLRAGLIEIPGTDVGALAKIGIALNGRNDCLFVVRNLETPIGRVAISNRGSGNLFLFGNVSRSRELSITVRVDGSQTTVAFPDAGAAPLHIPNAYLRSDGQTLYWGRGATSVASKIEIEGNNRHVIVGDDCMLSSGVWIRNHDMHTLFETTTGKVVNLVKANVVLEQHIWLGFEAFVLAVERIGFGSVVGARAFLKDSIPPECLAVGMPAKVVRRDISWCRSSSGIEASTLRRLQRLRDVTAVASYDTSQLGS